MNNFFNELKRRNVIKATIAYLVVSWIIIQVALTVLPTFGAAAWLLQGIIIALVVGLPVWIIVSWIYDITPQGIAKTPKDSEKYIYKELINRRTNAFIIVSLTIAVVVMGLKMSNVFDTGKEGEYSIAVLPFVNMSDDAEQEYFSDGISEEIINMLAQVPKLKVIGRSSSFAFKGKNMDLKLIGKQLNVDYLVEGNVRKSGNKLRIIAQLVNVADGTHMYSEKFDRELEDIFDIQDAISGEILNAIKIKLFDFDKENFLKKYTDNLVAYELYLKGKFYYNKYTKEGFLKAIYYFNQAIALDNNYAIAYADKGYSYLTLGYWNWLPYDQSIPQGRKAIEKSILLDDKIAESHLNVGRVMLHTDWNIRDAKIEFKKAQKINPNSPEVYVQLGMTAILSGNNEEALAYANKAISLDPFSVVNLFMAAAGTNNTERTLEISRKLIEIAPDFYGGYWWAGSSYMALGKHEEGIKAYETAVSFGEPNALARLGMVYGMMGEIDKAMELLERIKNIEGIESYGNNLIGKVYLGMGDLDTAFMYFDKAIENKEGLMLWSPVIFNGIDGLMDDPRVIEMIEKMGAIY